MFQCVAGVSIPAWHHSAADVFCKIKPHFWPVLSFETDSLHTDGSLDLFVVITVLQGTRKQGTEKH